MLPLLAALALSADPVPSRVATPPEPPIPGFTIPTIDLADQRYRQVVVDHEPKQYLGHPTTVLLEDGKTILAVYPKGHGKGAVVYKRSTDGGKTWSDRLPTPKSWETSKETPTIHRVIDAKGVKRLVMFSGFYPIRSSISEDDGKTWSELEPIGDFGGIVAMGSVVEVGKGRYMALFHDDGRYFTKDGKAEKPVRFTVYKTFSDDGGKTWGKPEAIVNSTEFHWCEPGAVWSPDKKQLAVLLRENSRKHNSGIMFSDDGGKTFTEPKQVPGSLTGDRHVGSYAADGRLVFTFRDTARETPTQGDWVAWVGKYSDLTGGTEGQYRVRLMDNTNKWDCAYAGLERLPDDTFVTTTYGHWSKGQPPYIMSVRFTLAEIDELAKPKK